MLVPQNSTNKSAKRRKKRSQENFAERQVPYFRPGKNPTILGGIILTFIVLGTLLTSRTTQQIGHHAQMKPDLVGQSMREVETLAKAIELFYLDTGRFPSLDEGLKALVRDPGVDGWNGHYVNLIKPDPWKTPYLYTHTKNAIEVRSAGPDRTFGTEDDQFAHATAPE